MTDHLTFPEIINDYETTSNPPKIIAHCARKAEFKNKLGVEGYI